MKIDAGKEMHRKQDSLSRLVTRTDFFITRHTDVAPTAVTYGFVAGYDGEYPHELTPPVLTFLLFAPSSPDATNIVTPIAPSLMA